MVQFFFHIVVLVFCFLHSIHTQSSYIPNNFSHKSALIFGISGQDGAYLTNLLLNKGYKVYGVVRRSSSIQTTSRLDFLLKNQSGLKNNLIYLYGDVTDNASVYKIINSIKPDEIYNLAAQSDVKISFEKPSYTTQVNALGALNIVEAIYDLELKERTRFFQASSSEIFGKNQLLIQTEESAYMPRSPYGIAKTYAHLIGIHYREAYKLFVCNGIMFNHESEFRGENFVTRIISQGVVKIKLGLLDTLKLGNLDAQRDWGYAQDYVEAMWLMLQHDEPGDYIVATGETHSVREFVEIAFKYVGIPLEWRGSGKEEIGIDTRINKKLVEVDPQKFRPAEINIISGSPAKAERILGWKRKVSFTDLIKKMIDWDMHALQSQNEIK